MMLLLLMIAILMLTSVPATGMVGVDDVFVVYYTTSMNFVGLLILAGHADDDVVVDDGVLWL
jgi:hypothetical protein